MAKKIKKNDVKMSVHHKMQNDYQECLLDVQKDALKAVIDSYRLEINLDSKTTVSASRVNADARRIEVDRILDESRSLLRRNFEMDTAFVAEARINLLTDCFDELSGISRKRRMFIERNLKELQIYDDAIKAICKIADKTDNPLFKASDVDRLYEEITEIGYLDELEDLPE